MKREPTKLECGLLGALLASIVLAFLFWLGIELSMLTYRARDRQREVARWSHVEFLSPRTRERHAVSGQARRCEWRFAHRGSRPRAREGIKTSLCDN